MEKQLRHAQFGVVTLRKMRNSKSIRITAHSQSDILITMPYYVSYSEAMAFLETSADEIQREIVRLQNKKANRQTIFTPDVDFGTYSRKLQLQPELRTNVQVKITQEIVYICYPADRDITNPVMQEVIRKAVEHAWRVEAHEVLPHRTQELAEKYGFVYSKLSLKNTRSCWGSCAVNNNISLSIHLMHLPTHLIDHVILHELCHTVHKNHGVAFWNLLNVVNGGRAREYARQMRKYSTRVY